MAPIGASADASGPAIASPSRPPACARSSTGASRGGRPPARWASPAPADRDQQPAEPDVGAARLGGGVGVRLGQALHQQDACGEQSRWYEHAAPTHGRAHDIGQHPAERPGAVGVDAESGHQPQADTEQARHLRGVPVERSADPRPQAGSGRGRRRARAGSLLRRHSGPNATSSPRSNRTNRRAGRAAS